MTQPPEQQLTRPPRHRHSARGLAAIAMLAVMVGVTGCAGSTTMSATSSSTHTSTSDTVQVQPVPPQSTMSAAAVATATPLATTPPPTATALPPTPTPPPVATTAPAVVQPPTPAPTKKPAPKPTQPPVVATTKAPAPKPAPSGVNGNPWGYNFTSGAYIYNPPGMFCHYFKCIASFWKNTKGYVEECADSTFSHSGGRRGSCSDHGGNWRPLYAH